MSKVKVLSNEEGRCPYCNSENIEYVGWDREDFGMLYYKCECEDCKRYFEEWYKLQFAGLNVGADGCIEAVVGDEIDYKGEE